MGRVGVGVGVAAAHHEHVMNERGQDGKTETHNRFKTTLIYYDIDTQSANFRGNPLRQATNDT